MKIGGGSGKALSEFGANISSVFCEMAHQSRTWCNGSHSADRSFDLEKCYREPEFPLDDAILEWLSHLKYVWGTWKKCETVKQMLHEYFASAPNPYIAALDILVNCDDFRQAKPNSLAYTVMDEFSCWISDKHTTFQHCLSEQVKLTAFDRMIKQRNISLVKIICNVYKMAEDRDIFLEPLKRLIWSKQYKEACQIAALLNLHSHFTVEDFLIPLVFQDKLTVAEEFLSSSISHQRDLVAFLDNLLGKRNIRNEADIIISNLEIPEVHASKLYYKPLSKLVARLTKQYDLPPTVCPNLNQKRNEGALQFLIHKRFQENSLGEESWREMAREAVGNNPRLQHDLVSVVGNYDPREAYYFANEFNIPRSRWPYSIENYFKFTVEARHTEDPSQNSHPKVFQEDRDENWDTEVTLEYHTLSLPADQIILVNTDRIFQRFLQDILTSVIPMVGIDSEWKPYFGTKKNELALIQIATKCRVYILDVMVIGNIYQDMWKQLGSELFGNGGIMKIGFGLQTDMVMIKHSLPFLGAVLQSASNCLDILLLWKKLVKDYSFVFPYSENTVSSGESLTHLVELCLGRQLNKSDQFSNWERRPLRPSQITYAALDAYCLLEVYDVIQQCCIQQEIPFDEVVQEVLSTAKSTKKSTKNHKRNMNDLGPIEVGPPPFPEPIPPTKLKVVCDITVEGLGKHLRICGVDTVFIRQNEHHDRCVRIANQQGRMVITRGRHVWRKISKHLPPGHCYAVTSDHLDEQLKEVLQYFNVVLSKEDVFSRCKLCNGNEFAKVSQATMKKLVAASQRLSNSLAVDEGDCKWDGEGFSSESDACSDEGLAGPSIRNDQQQTPEIIEGVDINRCLTMKGVTIQLENGILLPSLRPMLPLLDLHGVRRLDFHTSVLEELRDRLVAHINEIGQKEGKERDRKLKDLLAKSFPVVRVKALRPVVMCILRNTPHIDDKYLKVLVRDRELYSDTDTEVKRQIWKDNQSLFGDEVSPLLSQYIREKEHILFDHLNLANLFFTPSPKIRRQGEVVQKLAHMIGNSVKLYDMVLQFLRTLFLRTRNVHYCTLRAELLMALHDLEVQDIISVDPCHKFTWCLDACIREKNVDIKRSRELQGFLDSIKRGQEQVLGDLSMTLCDPYAINFLATSATKILQHLISIEGMPRDNTVLILLLRMLALGLSAWIMIDSQEFKEPKLDSQIVTKFLPALMSLMVDDQVRALNAKLPPDERESAITIIEHSGPPPDACQAYVQESSVASILAMYYTLHTARHKDRVGLMRVLGTLANCKNDRAFEDPFLHSLVSLLIHLADEFSAEDFCTVIFDEFFFAGLSRDNVPKHLLKLLWYIYPKLPANRLQTLVKALQPTSQHSESVHRLYESLQEKIGSSQDIPHIPTNMEHLDSPLMSVPTPAPL